MAGTEGAQREQPSRVRTASASPGIGQEQPRPLPGLLGLRGLAGNRAVAGLLAGGHSGGGGIRSAGVLQRLAVVQRDGPEDETLTLEASELKTVPSGPGGSIRLSDPNGDAAHNDTPTTAPLEIAAVAPRSTHEGERKGFDSRGEALAFAVTRAGGVGAGVVQRGRFFFVVTFKPNPDFSRSKVYAYTAAQGILAAVGTDGFVFDPSVTRYTPDGHLTGADQQTRLLSDPSASMPGTAAPNDLAQMAGVPPPGVKADGTASGAAQNAVEIPPDQVEAFIRQYLVARGMEWLDANEAATLKLIEDFKPTTPGTEQAAGSGVSTNAKTMIDKARAIAGDLAAAQDEEIRLERLMSDRDWEQSLTRNSLSKWKAEGVEKTLRDWKTDLEGRQKAIADRKNDLFNRNAVVAQLVKKREPDTGLGTDVKRALDSDATWALPGLKLGYEAYKKVSPDNTATTGLLKSGTDDEVRTQMLTKLDGVVKAVREVKARTLTGDLKFLTSMPRLFDRALADFSRITGRNAMLANDLKTARVQSNGDVDLKAGIEVAGSVLQLVGFFFPPAEFLGAVMTFGVAASRVGEAADAKTVADAAVRPDEAMLDPDQAQKKMSEATLALALESVNLGMALGGASKLIEGGQVPAEFKAAAAGSGGLHELTSLASAEREVTVAASLDSVGEAMTVREAGGYASIRAALPPGSPSLKRVDAWQNAVAAQMTEAVGEHQLAKMGGADVGAAGLRPEPLPAGRLPAPTPGPSTLPPIPPLDAKDVEVAQATLAKAVGGKPEDAAALTGIRVENPEALDRYMKAAPPPVLTPDAVRRAMAGRPTIEGMSHLEPAAMKAYLEQMEKTGAGWGKSTGVLSKTDPAAVALVKKRSDMLREAINAGARPGMPRVGVGVGKLEAGAGGHFNMTTWRIEFPWETLAKDIGGPGGLDFQWLTTAGIHEFTHVDQWWGVARMMATEGTDARTIARTLDMDLGVATMAVQDAKRAPLRRYSPEAAPYREVFASLTGAKSVDRSGILRAYHAATEERNAATAALDKADEMLEAAEKNWRRVQSQPPGLEQKYALLEYRGRQADWKVADTRMDAAEKDYQTKFGAYMALPEERQAQEAQARLARAGGPRP